MAERLGPEVELALLVGHEAGGCEEAGAEGQRKGCVSGAPGAGARGRGRGEGRAALTWPRRRPVFPVAAGVRSDRRSSASYSGPRGSQWRPLKST